MCVCVCIGTQLDEVNERSKTDFVKFSCSYFSSYLASVAVVVVMRLQSDAKYACNQLKGNNRAS